MPNPNLIKPKQLDPSVVDFIKEAVSQDPYVLFVSGGTQTILGQKTFNVAPNVPYSGTDSQTVSKLYISDQFNVVKTTINANLSGVIHTTGNEHAQGIKTFDSIIGHAITGGSLHFDSGNFTGTLLAPNPDLSTDPPPRTALNLNFFYNQGIVFKTGDQNIIGNKTFLDSPFLFNQATGLKQPARYDQLINSGNKLQTQINALAKASGSKISGFGGVISFNGESGNIIAVGRGNVTVKQQGDIAFISGALPILSGSGVHLIQGEQGLLGPYFHPRGVWHTGITYGYLDFVDHSGTSFVSTTGHFSTLSNMPGTGGILLVAPWRILASAGTGTQGPRGAWKYRGNFNSATHYVFDNAVSYIGSTYGLSGSFSSGLLAPTGATWFIIAKSGAKGLRGLQGATGAMGAWRYRGDYDSGTLYGLNDAVTFNGSTFGVDELFVSGQLAPTGEGWITIARSGQIGPQGVIGPTGAWQYSGVFNPQQNYFFNNAVTFNGSTYGYSGLITSGLFPTTGTDWYLIAASGLQGLTGAWQYSGYWNSGTIYYFNNAVSYLGSTYGYSGSSITSGFLAPTGIGWYLLAASGGIGPSGNQGFPGLAFVWKSNWLSTGNYVSGDSIYYQGSSYGINQSTSGTIPNTGVPWFLIAQSGQPTIWRDGNGVPDNSTGIDGDFWLNDIAGDIYRRVGGTYAVISNINAGLAQRISVSGTTNSIPYLQTTGMLLPMAKTSALISIQTDYPAWVRIYGSLAERSGDVGRPIDADPTPGSGVMFDGITTSGSPILWTSPVATFTSHENPPSTGVPIAITNTIAGTGQAITLTVRYLQLEK